VIVVDAGVLIAHLADCCVLLAADQARAQVGTFDDQLTVSGRALGCVVRKH